jgi:hypothetical protein
MSNKPLFDKGDVVCVEESAWILMLVVWVTWET